MPSIQVSPVHKEIREGGRTLVRVSQIGGELTVHAIGANREERRASAAKALPRAARKELQR